MSPKNAIYSEIRLSYRDDINLCDFAIKLKTTEKMISLDPWRTTLQNHRPITVPSYRYFSADKFFFQGSAHRPISP